MYRCVYVCMCIDLRPDYQGQDIDQRHRGLMQINANVLRMLQAGHPVYKLGAQLILSHSEVLLGQNYSVWDSMMLILAAREMIWN